MRGAFGPGSVDIELKGLRRGKHYSFMQFEEPPPRATVTVTESGPVIENYFANPTAGVHLASRKPPKDFLGPHQGMEDRGNGTLSVSQSGRSGSLQVTLPNGDSISGHWTCGSQRRTGATSRPALASADLPPSVNECASGSISDPTPPPVSCPNGDLNVEAWEAGTPLDSAGQLTSLTTVEADIRREYREFLKTGAAPTAASLRRSYSIAALYYGWKFSPSAAQVVAEAGCVH
ncbi:MAG: hypothetical protein ACREOA_05925 [Candidatus Dormibacteria bacterium]